MIGLFSQGLFCLFIKSKALLHHHYAIIFQATFSNWAKDEV